MNRIAAIVGLVLILTAVPRQLSAAQRTPFRWETELSSDGEKLQVKALIPVSHYLYEHTVKLTLIDNGGKTIVPINSPVAVKHRDDNYGDTSIYPAPVAVWTFNVAAAKKPLTLEIRSQGCRDASATKPALCFMPERLTLTVGAVSVTAPSNSTASAAAPAAAAPLAATDRLLTRFTVRNQTGGLLDAAGFLRFLSGAQERDLFQDKSLLMIVVLVLLGGLGLNLTPCVLPMIPVTLAIIGAGKQAESSRSGMVRGTVYGLGMALAYGILGILAVLGGARFGELNSSPWFNLGVAAVFAVLGLAMFDLFAIDLSRFGAGFNPKMSKGRLIPVFVLGVIAALLAGACVAPVVIAVLLYSTTKYAAGHALALLLPLLLGVGMALPWPWAGAGLAVIPKPGRWMVKVKYIFGVIILAAAVYYGWTGSQLFGTAGAAGGTAEVTVLNQRLEAALQTGKPVLIDFWASWCKNCLYMEKTTFKDADVIKALSAYEVIKFQAEDVNAPQTKALLDRFAIQGLPAFVILTPVK